MRTQFKRYALVLLALLALSACAKKPPTTTPKPVPPVAQNATEGIQDLQLLPQKPSAYVDANGTDDLLWLGAEARAADWLGRFFGPWSQKRPQLKRRNALWGIKRFKGVQGYDATGRPLPAGRLAELTAECRAKAYPNVTRKAIATRNTSLRVMPTMEPFYFDPKLPGEGPPFDHFQNSAIWAGTPVFVTHKSRSGRFYHVEAGFAAGWVPAQDLAWADDAFIKQYRTGSYAAILRDKVPVRDASGRTLFATHIGAVFPTRGPAPEEGPVTILAPVAGPGGLARVAVARIEPGQGGLWPRKPRAREVARISDEMAGQRYGWGGVNEDRDCSAMVRDILAPFGLWLPRNSAPQSKSGRVVNFEGLDDAAKERIILAEGVPFRTLIALPGHIMLYVGQRDGKAIVFHNIWGLRTESPTGVKGRRVIGRAVCTTLAPGKELEDVRRADKLLVTRARSMVILGDEPQGGKP